MIALTSALLMSFAALAEPDGRGNKPSGFAGVVVREFAAWDADQNGELSPGEIDLLSVDPTIKGDEAAAVASLKLIVRSNNYLLPKLTKEYLSRPTERRSRGGASEQDQDSADRELSEGRASRDGERPRKQNPDFQTRYSMSLRTINQTPRKLFLDDTPDIDRCRQGPLGDCFFVCMAGALVLRDPEALKNVIKAAPDGGYEVTFGTGRTVQVSEMTDAEIAMTSRTGNEGLWLPVLEKAFGMIRNEARPEQHRTEQATDAIALGGSISTAIRALTGHEPNTVVMRSRAEKSQGQKLDDLINTAGEKLARAFEEKRLVGASTGDDKLPPGINGRHAYAVLGYDAKTRMVRLWNPHGNSFRPRGTPGIETGYSTRGGKFEMPLGDVVRVFRSLSIESDRLTRDTLRKKPAPRDSSMTR
ncbi:MAG: hypothetical protein H7210_11725 [Pyrinomonadaceae bacterium]|nr:hypothetical protein [Phycisphaerales bacterium]